MQDKTKQSVKTATPQKKSWQGQKSAMTRAAILEAATQCFVKHGYKNTYNVNILH